ncbi:hypothetical protein ACLGL2_00915 [Parvimonas sp. G1641]|uniref:hypothetical protein n=1 Tax=Parvimonas sp. G1641 TaxID=3388846 RepID=UPI0039817C2A
MKTKDEFDFKITKDGYEFYFNNEKIRIVNYTICFQTILSAEEQKHHLLYLTGFIGRGQTRKVLNIKYDFDTKRADYQEFFNVREIQNEIQMRL